MKRPEISIAAQGWLIIVGALALSALLIVPNLITYRGASADESFTASRIADYRARLEALPQQVASKEKSRDALEYGQTLQQAFSNAVRRNGGRLTELANLGENNEPIPALEWSIGFEGDLLDFMEIISAIDEIEGVLLLGVSAGFNPSRPDKIIAKLKITAPLIQFSVSEMSLGLKQGLTVRNPFDPKRSDHSRGITKSSKPQTADLTDEPKLLGLRKVDGDWTATIRFQLGLAPITVGKNADTPVGRIEAISPRGVFIRSKNGTEFLLHPFDQSN